MSHCNNYEKQYNRRDFLNKTSLGLGAAALGSLISPSLSLAGPSLSPSGYPLGKPHFSPKVKRVIYLFQSGGPSQLESFDPKPLLREMNGKETPRICQKRTATYGYVCRPEKPFPWLDPNLTLPNMEKAGHG